MQNINNAYVFIYYYRLIRIQYNRSDVIKAAGLIFTKRNKPEVQQEISSFYKNRKKANTMYTIIKQNLIS